MQFAEKSRTAKYHSSGHIYFTLKDETGVLKAVMFRGSVDKGLAFHMDVGDRVVVLGEIRIYERDGQYQLYAQQVTRDGVGILYQKFMERKKELEEMGMFAQEYKRDIPRYASRVGIVTAPTELRSAIFRIFPIEGIRMYNCCCILHLCRVKEQPHPSCRVFMRWNRKM